LNPAEDDPAASNRAFIAWTAIISIVSILGSIASGVGTDPDGSTFASP